MSCRLGHDTKHFNVGQYRRVQKTTSEIQNASFFDPNNEVGPAYSICAMTPISLTSLSRICPLRPFTLQSVVIQSRVYIAARC